MRMTNDTISVIKNAKMRVDQAQQSGERVKALDALKNIMVNRYDDLVEAIELYEILENENKDLKEQIENLTSELDKADEEYNALRKQLNAPGEETGALDGES